jgi:predicted nucleic-acid-binding protein
MIAFDSNILIRYFQRDDVRQTAIAENLVDARTPSEPGWIAVPVLMELLWVLSRSYKLRRDSIVEILEKLLESEDLVVADEERVRLALATYRRGRADFADCLIVECARDAGCSRTFTFDEKAARDAGMELLA